MERLTFEVHDGGMFVKESDVKTVDIENEVMHTGNAIRKLAEYEDIGLTPQQLIEIDKMYAEKCRELSESLEQLEKYRNLEKIFRSKMTDDACKFLSDKEEFAKWLDRNKWIAKKCDEYVRAEEQGRLPKLPFAVGDTVYEICEGFIEPCTVEIIFIADYKDKEGNSSYMVEIHYDREDCPWVSTEIFFTDIGKTVFLTQEEAEAALQKIKEAGNE